MDDLRGRIAAILHGIDIDGGFDGDYAAGLILEIPEIRDALASRPDKMLSMEVVRGDEFVIVKRHPLQEEG